MKIVDRETFLGLTCPVVYAEVKMPCTVGNFRVKTSNVGNTWHFRDFDVVCADDSIEMIDRMGEMADQGKQFPMEVCAIVDDNYDPDAKYLVYDTSDIEKIVDVLGVALYSGT